MAESRPLRQLENVSLFFLNPSVSLKLVNKKLRLKKPLIFYFSIIIVIILALILCLVYSSKVSRKLTKFKSNQGFSFIYPASLYYVYEGSAPWPAESAMEDLNHLLLGDIIPVDSDYYLKPVSYSMVFIVLYNPNKDDLVSFVKKFIEEDNAKIIPDSYARTDIATLKQERINGVDAVSLVPGPYYDYSFGHHNKGRVYFMEMKNNKILQIAYPTEFCNIATKGGVQPVQCFKDIRNEYMEEILNSVSLD